ncbi:MAG: ImmA/IrrE family metallo-endopeptidase [Deltaproteobacteria bacterium]|nr:ImmA/IrrE family metallo-endopeptidase [Deltaproteobacteria bacterium]
MVAKVIKNEEEYDAALGRIDELMDADPGTAEGDELELLVTLVELYEQKAHPIGLPDPVEAILFRMEQAGLKQKDLAPFLGSRSKVSEVLSRQRPLSLGMMRRLHEGLQIPAEVLLQEPGGRMEPAPEGLDWAGFPVAEMARRAWFRFEGTAAEAKRQARDLIASWSAPLGAGALQPALLRRHVRSGSAADGAALDAWRIRVCLLALEQDLPPYRPGTVSQGFVRDLARLSYLDEGPLLAREFLSKNGIHFVVEPHLPHTHLDGAAIRLPNGAPLVALTLRHDRLDNFWFTLCHELAHVALHFEGDEPAAYLDDLDQADAAPCEAEADRWAAEALIPPELWSAARLFPKPSPQQVLRLAASLRISPAIPAGRIRRETRNYKLLGNLVGYRQVRKLFLPR